MKGQRGFTLWEMIITLLVVAMAFVALAPWLRVALQGWLLVVTVEPVLEQSGLAMTRLQREIALARCDSVQSSSNGLQWTSLADGLNKKVELSNGSLYWQSYLLAEKVSAWQSGVQSNGAGHCLVSVGWRVNESLPLSAQIWVRSAP
ncbi:MAG: type II secretion system protein [Magnetococcales bacterium]|nr:type II secretion system protein [Magnetococcales bacterium]NGZ27826.1 type II secretion system protein [Magnetococcales bacterium]